MKKRTPKSETLTELILEIFQLNGALLLAGNKITKPYGLTSARWQVMGAISLAEQPLTVSQIARRMGLTRQAVQRIANDLIRLGMIVLTSNLDHKRAPLLSISEVGEAVMSEVDKAQIEWVNQLSQDLEKEQLKQALKTLQSVKENTEQLNQTIQEK